MRILIAGAASDLGSAAARALASRGHDLAGITRSNHDLLRSRGIEPVTADVLDAAAVDRAVAAARPQAIVQTLNALPERGPTKLKHLAQTNRLRVEGTANLVAAARRHGVERYVAESLVLAYGTRPPASPPVAEDAPLLDLLPGPLGDALRAVASLEQQVLGIGGIALRMGIFYGRGVGSTEDIARRVAKRRIPVFPVDGVVPFVHIDDAGEAIALAVEHAPPGGVYNVAGDEPATLGEYVRAIAEAIGAPPPRKAPLWVARLAGDYFAVAVRGNLPVSSEKAKRELGWSPRYRSVREGLGGLTPAGRSA